jgi:hypothetical protein
MTDSKIALFIKLVQLPVVSIATLVLYLPSCKATLRFGIMRSYRCNSIQKGRILGELKKRREGTLTSTDIVESLSLSSQVAHNVECDEHSVGKKNDNVISPSSSKDSAAMNRSCRKRNWIRKKMQSNRAILSPQKTKISGDENITFSLSNSFDGENEIIDIKFQKLCISRNETLATCEESVVLSFSDAKNELSLSEESDDAKLVTFGRTLSSHPSDESSEMDTLSKNSPEDETDSTCSDSSERKSDVGSFHRSRHTADWSTASPQSSHFSQDSIMSSEFIFPHQGEQDAEYKKENTNSTFAKPVSKLSTHVQSDRTDSFGVLIKPNMIDSSSVYSDIEEKALDSRNISSESHNGKNDRNQTKTGPIESQTDDPLSEPMFTLTPLRHVKDSEFPNAKISGTNVQSTRSFFDERKQAPASPDGEKRLNAILQKVSKKMEHTKSQRQWWEDDSKILSLLSPKTHDDRDTSSFDFDTTVKKVISFFEEYVCNASLCSDDFEDDRIGNEIQVDTMDHNFVDDDITMDLTTSIFFSPDPLSSERRLLV